MVDYEYKVLLSRGFDLEVVHPTEHILSLLALTGAPLRVRACLLLPLLGPTGCTTMWTSFVCVPVLHVCGLENKKRDMRG